MKTINIQSNQEQAEKATEVLFCSTSQTINPHKAWLMVDSDNVPMTTLEKRNRFLRGHWKFKSKYRLCIEGRLNPLMVDWSLVHFTEDGDGETTMSCYNAFLKGFRAFKEEIRATTALEALEDWTFTVVSRQRWFLYSLGLALNDERKHPFREGNQLEQLEIFNLNALAIKHLSKPKSRQLELAAKGNGILI
jgi:hypothetical protein